MNLALEIQTVFRTRLSATMPRTLRGSTQWGPNVNKKKSFCALPSFLHVLQAKYAHWASHFTVYPQKEVDNILHLVH